MWDTPPAARAVRCAAAEGRFWIEPSTGRVVQTEPTLRSAGNPARIGVRYADQRKLGLWLPVRMDGKYETASESRTITGRADYREFRTIEADVS